MLFFGAVMILGILTTATMTSNSICAFYMTRIVPILGESFLVRQHLEHFISSLTHQKPRDIAFIPLISTDVHR